MYSICTKIPDDIPDAEEPSIGPDSSASTHDAEPGDTTKGNVNLLYINLNTQFLIKLKKKNYFVTFVFHLEYNLWYFFFIKELYQIKFLKQTC